ncbi:uncharacterized protein EI90DRAFT_497614 [Cantharellus anzutake]|uniref:uncharacterized protein n=1 Tax=Cantharellus anzutake TaxID=1750568 RepID=UPI00190562E8|nr:uncharacterized protein EI90DRAFT_497614 [Cantharellus anzutake]KAF8334010.1 hypothetical protein EI90DRAFT_497614 [Cantharellus anzutake]
MAIVRYLRCIVHNCPYAMTSFFAYQEISFRDRRPPRSCRWRVGTLAPYGGSPDSALPILISLHDMQIRIVHNHYQLTTLLTANCLSCSEHYEMMASQLHSAPRPQKSIMSLNSVNVQQSSMQARRITAIISFDTEPMLCTHRIDPSCVVDELRDYLCNNPEARDAFDLGVKIAIDMNIPQLKNLIFTIWRLL